MSDLTSVRIDKIVPEIKAEGWLEAFEEMTEGPTLPLLIKDRNVLLTDLVFRENLASTFIGDGVAMPHVVTEGVYHCLVIFGRSRRGVSFNSESPGIANLIFIVASSPDCRFECFKLMKDLLNFVQDRRTRQDILTAVSSKKLDDIFNGLNNSLVRKPVKILDNLLNILHDHVTR